MYLSLNQIINSLDRLEGLHTFFGYAFFAFKKARLPIGDTVEFRYSFIRDNILEPYYRLESVPNKYFNPFNKNSYWVSHRYESTSLQRIITDTFGDAFLRDHKAHKWGWSSDYISILGSLMAKHNIPKIPAVDLAIWLYRNERINDGKDVNEFLLNKLISEFNISHEEMQNFFEEKYNVREISFQETPVADKDIVRYFGLPEGQAGGGPERLSRLGLTNVGPFGDAQYVPTEKTNLIAGDNSLGKTFLLDLVWWSITGVWVSYPADPFRRRRSNSEITAEFDGGFGRGSSLLSSFSRVERKWSRPNVVADSAVVYVRHDNSVSIFVPEHFSARRNEVKINVDREKLWNGLAASDFKGRETRILNGIISDVVIWQSLEQKYSYHYKMFCELLKNLSPPEGKRMRLGNPSRIDGDSREMPTLRLNYGDVPFVYTSAGVQKSIAIAYSMTLVLAEFSTQKLLEDRQVVVLFDELESHLHPRWQRSILPALINTWNALAPTVKLQMHVATHSPLVLASIEGHSDPECDSIHLLKIEEDDIFISRKKYQRHGSVDRWLQSSTFGLVEPTSVSAENALSKAKKLMDKRDRSPSEAHLVEKELFNTLPDDHPFWIRWNRFKRMIEG